MDSINNLTQFYEKALDAASLRQKVIAENIANIDTPNYRHKEVAFEDTFRKLIAQESGGGGIQAQVTDPRHIRFGHFDMASMQVPIKYQSGKLDINTEMASLVKNQIMYKALASKVGGLLSGINYVIDSVK